MSAPRQRRQAATLAGGWAAGWWLLARLPPPPPVPGSAVSGVPAVLPEACAAPGRRLSVVIPARDEAHAIGGLLASLRAQGRPADEIVVVDDGSGDATAAIAARAGATVLESARLPVGWTGKTWACHQGAERSAGDVLVFLDADVTLAPDALARLEATWLEAGGLVSVEPFHRIRRPYERLSAVCNVVSLMATGAFGPGRRKPVALAFGPCMVIGRDDYRRIGGHAHPDVRGEITEDLAMARRMRAEGLGVRLFAGRQVLSFRMYSGGPAQLAEGWTKSLGAGAGGARPHVVAATGLWVTAALQAAIPVLGVPLRLALSSSCRAPGGSSCRGRGGPGGAGAGGLGAPVAVYGAFAVQVWWMLRRVGNFGVTSALAFPVPLWAFVVLFSRSAWRRAWRLPLAWRGRSVPAP